MTRVNITNNNALRTTEMALKCFIYESESCSVMSNSLQPHGLYSPWNSPGQNTGMGSCSPLQGSSQPSAPRSPSSHADSLPAEPQGKPTNTEVGSLSLLQQIFLTQEANQGLLHCRQILYQLSYEGSPKCLSHVWLFVTPWTTQSAEFSRPEYWSG